jgi:hypothetical protein
VSQDTLPATSIFFKYATAPYTFSITSDTRTAKPIVQRAIYALALTRLVPGLKLFDISAVSLSGRCCVLDFRAWSNLGRNFTNRTILALSCLHPNKRKQTVSSDASPTQQTPSNPVSVLLTWQHLFQKSGSLADTIARIANDP